MPCPIKIKEKIEESINTALPNRQEVMSREKAKSISTELNTLWNGAISKISEYSSQGGYKVLINDLKRAIDKEFITQEQAEAQFEHDLDFFNGDEVLMEQENRNYFQKATPQVNYSLKAIDILQSDKAIQVFEKGKKNNWDLNKILTELQVPKEQKQLILDKNLTNREEIITSLLADNSFVVEINQGLDNVFGKDTTPEPIWEEVEIEVAEGEFETEMQIVGNEVSKSTFYSNLTVPGGTNYTENEIATPDITPNIKGHAQFSTDNGIGWFRSDEQSENSNKELEEYKLLSAQFNEMTDASSILPRLEELEKKYGTLNSNEIDTGGVPTKTRRILEVQSDLFQKGRDSKDLTTPSKVSNEYTVSNNEYSNKDEFPFVIVDNSNGEVWDFYKTKEEANKAFFRQEENNNSDNQFLQLLNKKGNWVNFFIQSIVQDSVKKGYEKVLFPTGETAAKVEGHETIADEINKLKDVDIYHIALKNVKSNTGILDSFSTKEEAISKVQEENEAVGSETYEFREGNPNQQEINALKTQGLEKLKPVEAFYTNRVTNILNKLYDVTEITDEHGNTWNEVGITNEKNVEQSDNILLQKDSKERPFEASPTLIKLMKKFIKQIGVDYKLVENIVINGVKQDANGVAMIMQNLIQIVEGKESQALPEEAMHFAVEIIEQTNPTLFKQLLKEIAGTSVLEQVRKEYSGDPNYKNADGTNNVLKLKKEAIAKALVENLDEKIVKSWWEKIIDYLNGLFYGKSGFDKMAMDVLSGKNIGTAEDIAPSDNSIYFQKIESKGEEVFNKLKQKKSEIELKNTEELDDEGIPKKAYFVNGNKIRKRVSDYVHKFYEGIFGVDISEKTFQNEVNNLKAQKGTEKHQVLEDVQNMLVDPATGLLREEPLNDDEYIENLNDADKRMYIILRDNLKERILKIEENAPGTRFLSEITVFDEKKSVAGTVDFMSISPKGKINVLDWKFIDINTETYDDVPWYKIKAWELQMNWYKMLIMSQYGVQNKDFEQTRMIPILAQYSKADYDNEILPRLINVKIGDVNTENIEEDYLLPVGVRKERTGDEVLDKLLEKFNGVYDKLTDQKVTEDERPAKREQLNSLFKAIRHLQIKKDARPVIDQVKIINKQITTLKAKYEKDIKNAENLSEEKKEEFAGLLNLNLSALQPYLDLKELLYHLDDSEANTSLKKDLRDTIYDIEGNIKTLEKIDEEFGKKHNDVSWNPEKIVKGISKWFSTTATIQMDNLQTLYKMVNEALYFSEAENLAEVGRLSILKDAYVRWATNKGLSKKNYFNSIMKEDENELIDQYKSEFYSKLKSNIKNKNYSWIKDNIDVDAYKAHIKEKRAKQEKFILTRTRLETSEIAAEQINQELAKMYSKYNLSTAQSTGWLLYGDISHYPKKETWESDKWQELHKTGNEPALEFYNYIIERNLAYKQTGYLDGKTARKFLPFMRKTFTENLSFDGKRRGIGEQLLRNLSVDDATSGYGNTDPITGEIVNKVPKYFLSELEDGEYSTDLFKTMTLYNQFAINFKNLTGIEQRALQLLRAERNKKSILSSKFGKAQQDEFGNNVENNNNIDNAKLLEDFISAIVYQQKYVKSAAFDASLGKINNLGKTINEKIGFKLMPEITEERQLSINKSVDFLNRQFQMTALGFNSLSALSNYFGGNTTALINSGKYFSKYDHYQSQLWVTGNKMQGVFLGDKSLNTDAKKVFAALNYFLPFTDSHTREAAKNLSLNKFSEESVQDLLMILMRSGDESIQTINFFSFLKNAIIVDDKIVNVREYLKSTEEYSQFYKGSEQDRNQRKDKFEIDAKELISKQGVLKLSEVKNGELVIPGVEQKSKSVVEFRRKIQSFTADALGSMSPENRRMVNMNVYTNSAMVFKNWIPRLADIRVGALKYNAASDAYEWGRMRTITKVLTTDIMRSIKNLQVALGGDSTDWVNQVRELYEIKKEDYKKATGKTLKMTETEFIDLVNQNIKNQTIELVILASLLAVLFSLKAMMPDDDDEDMILTNRMKFLVKATDKLTDELMYFYDLSTPFNLISKGVFPALGMLKTYKKALTETSKDIFGFIIQDDKMMEDAKSIKYIMKSIPATNQLSSYIPLFFPDIAKDLGIRMVGQYGSR